MYLRKYQNMSGLTAGIFVRTIGTVLLAITEETTLYAVAVATSQGSFL
jgi:hypothetical protein